MIEFDINYLKLNNINAHQYIIVKLLHEGDLKKLRGYLLLGNSSYHLMDDLNHLYQTSYLAEPPCDPIAFSKLRLSDKFRKEISFADDPFDEFYETFPTKVLRPDGNNDYLRVEHKRSRKIYHNIVQGNRAKHEFIIQCLLAEINDRSIKGQMSFFKRMPAWLVSESWKAYQDMVQSDHTSTNDTKEAAYGTDIE